MTNINTILNIFESFRMEPTPIDQYHAVGRAKLAEKIEPFVQRGEQIPFVMLGFPMKSPNDRDKVLGRRPDLAEEVALKNFETFNDRMRAAYAPGVRISIVSDGYVFSDIMGVSDGAVAAYNEEAFDMAAGGPVKWYDLRDFYRADSSINTMRGKVVDQFGITPEELERRILTDPDVNALYRGMIKFITLDLANRAFESNSQLQKTAKKIAREMMFRNEAYSALIRSEFGDNVRLSMHPSQNNGTKYSFQMIPSAPGKAWTSPWHCALLVDEAGDYVTIHRKDAEVAGYGIVTRDGRPYNFAA